MQPIWPEQVRTLLATTLGQRTTVERLSGMSLSGVWRVRSASGSLVVKAGPSPVEARFYERVAPSLRAAGIPIPTLEMALHEPDAHWLAIEDIPEPLPIPAADAWLPDQRIVTILARLHATTRAWPPDLPSPPERAWTDAMTQAAFDWLPGIESEALERLQREHAAISEPWCWISGDPNPRNWGLRADGTPVLFDWELFGPGRPATDLAIIVPGLGDHGAYTRVGAAYLAAWDDREPLPWDTDDLTRQIAVAKVASVVQLLHGHASGTARVSDDLLTWLQTNAPAWLRMITQ